MGNMNKFPVTLQQFEAECRVRGIYLSLSCDLERLISDIIAICQESNESELESYKLKQPFEFGRKLRICKDAVKKHNEGYYNFYIPNFDIADKLCEHRTMLAHGFADDNGAKFKEGIITFKWIIKNEEKKNVWTSKEILFKPFIMETLTYRNSVFEFMKLHSAIYADKFL